MEQGDFQPVRNESSILLNGVRTLWYDNEKTFLKNGQTITEAAFEMFKWEQNLYIRNICDALKIGPQP